MRIKKATKEWWKKSPRYKKMRQINLSLLSNKFLEITSSINCRQASILTQLRTGHIPINAHLHKIQKSNMPYCPQYTCIQAMEDIHHLIFTCPKYTQERHQLILRIGRKNFSNPKLLTDKNIIPHTLTYLNKTGQFKQVFGDIELI